MAHLLANAAVSIIIYQEFPPTDYQWGRFFENPIGRAGEEW